MFEITGALDGGGGGGCMGEGVQKGEEEGEGVGL